MYRAIWYDPKPHLPDSGQRQLPMSNCAGMEKTWGQRSDWNKFQRPNLWDSEVLHMLKHITLQSPKRANKDEIIHPPTSNFQATCFCFHVYFQGCHGVTVYNLQKWVVSLGPKNRKNFTETQLQGPRSLSGWLYSAPVAIQNALGTPGAKMFNLGSFSSSHLKNRKSL